MARPETLVVGNCYFNGGRTRVLTFPVVSERDSIVDLCRRVLTAVYAMRRGDLLDYYFLRKSEIAKHREPEREGGCCAGWARQTVSWRRFVAASRPTGSIWRRSGPPTPTLESIGYGCEARRLQDVST